MIRESRLVGPGTPVATTVHHLQIDEDSTLHMQAHDRALDSTITPKEAIETQAPHPSPKGLSWSRIRPDTNLTPFPCCRSSRPAERALNVLQEHP